MNSTDIEKALDWYFLRVEAVDVAVRRWLDGRPVMLHPTKRSWQSGLDRNGLARLLPWLRFENSRGADIYLRPARALVGVSLVFLDDLHPNVAGKVASKYSALAVETSSGSAQVWIAVAQPLTEPGRLVVQRALANKCHSDLGSVSGEHFGRLPGFVNRKPAHTDHPWVRVVAATDGIALDPRPFLASASNNHAITIAGRPAAGRTHGSANVGDASAEDWCLARRALETGTAPERIVNQIAERAIARGKRATTAACLDYARRTIERAMRA